VGEGGHKEGSRRLSCTMLFVLLGSLVVVGACNFAMFKSMYNAYGEENAYFVSQGVNFLYVVYGGLLVYPRFLCSEYQPIRPRRASSLKHSPKLPKSRFWQRANAIDHRWKFLIMGTLDCFGTFFTAMGAVYTPGVFQTLLNQTLIPCTMLFSYLLLRTKYAPWQIVGASVIVIGACVTIGPAVVLQGERASKQFRWYACLVYFFSNVPMAISSVYKEMSFRNEKIDVLYLTQWVSIFQLFVGFLLAPLQRIPGFGSLKSDTPDVWTQMTRGTDCWLEINKECRARSTFILLSGYVAINFAFNTLGLYLTKRSSATLTSIAYALLLPITTLTFSLSIMGSYREKITKFTWIGLALTISGFLIYRSAPSRHRRRKSVATPTKRESKRAIPISRELSKITKATQEDDIRIVIGEGRAAELKRLIETPPVLCGAGRGLEGREEGEEEVGAFQERTGALGVVLVYPDGSPVPSKKIIEDIRKSRQYGSVDSTPGN